MWSAAAPQRASQLKRDFGQHIPIGNASSNFTQGYYGSFVFGIDPWGVTLNQLACTVGGSQDELKSVWNGFEAIFYSNTSHALLTLNGDNTHRITD
jgi:hypothetical protein